MTIKNLQESINQNTMYAHEKIMVKDWEYRDFKLNG